MTWGNRFKLVLGLMLVLVVVAAGTLVFNQRQTRVTSTSAQVAAEPYAVGTDYGGVVEEAFVEEGDTVREGQRMFAVVSMQLERDIAQGLVSPGAATVDPDGSLVVRASASGAVSQIGLGEGSYAGAGSVLATIDASGSHYVLAEFILSPRDFGRIADGAGVTLMLPDGTEIRGSVADLTVETVQGDAHVTARIESEALSTADPGALTKPGTPLVATLELRDDGPLAGVGDALSDFARKIGL